MRMHKPSLVFLLIVGVLSLYIQLVASLEVHFIYPCTSSCSDYGSCGSELDMPNKRYELAPFPRAVPFDGEHSVAITSTPAPTEFSLPYTKVGFRRTTQELNVDGNGRFQINVNDTFNPILISSSVDRLEMDLRLQYVDNSLKPSVPFSVPLVGYQSPGELSISPSVVPRGSRTTFTIVGDHIVNTWHLYAKIDDITAPVVYVNSSMVRFTMDTSSLTTQDYEVSLSFGGTHQYSGEHDSLLVWHSVGTVSIFAVHLDSIEDNSCHVFGHRTLDLQTSLTNLDVSYSLSLSLHNIPAASQTSCTAVDQSFRCPCPEVWMVNAAWPARFPPSLTVHTDTDTNSPTEHTFVDPTWPRIRHTVPSLPIIEPTAVFINDTVDLLTLRGMHPGLLSPVAENGSLEDYNVTLELRLEGQYSGAQHLPCYHTPSASNGEDLWECHTDHVDWTALCPSSTIEGNTLICTLRPRVILERIADGMTGPFATDNDVVLHGVIAADRIVPSAVPVGASSPIPVHIIFPHPIPSLSSYAVRIGNNGVVSAFASSSDTVTFTLQPDDISETFDDLLEMTLANPDNLTYTGSDSHDALSQGFFSTQSRFVVYDADDLVFTNITDSVRSGDEQVDITGSGFITDTHAVRIQVVLLDSSLEVASREVCSLVTETAMACPVPSVEDTGILLPQTFAVKITFNDGVTWEDTELKLRIEQSEEPVAVQVVPDRVPWDVAGRNLRVSVKGRVGGVDSCQFRLASTDNDNNGGSNNNDNDDGITSPAEVATGNEEASCSVPSSVQSIAQAEGSNAGSSVVEFRLRLLKGTDMVSNPLRFSLYRHPPIQHVSPTSLKASGGETLFLSTAADAELLPYNLRLKIGDTLSPEVCAANTTVAACITPAAKDNENVPVSISYNTYTFKEIPQTVTLEACGPGRTAPSYEEDCSPCQAGTYKPLEGYFNCIQCQTGTYQPQEGAAQCQRCPDFTTTTGRNATAVTQCTCIEGYYTPTEERGVRCDRCQEGLRCPGGVVQPTPAEGWWWNEDLPDMDDRLDTLVKCNPASWCTGGGSCATGHTGEACITCEKGYYKSNEQCVPCDSSYQWGILLIVGVGGFLVFLVFRFARLEMRYLSSLSIGTGYWQIIAIFSTYNFNWPDALLTALNVLRFFHLDLDLFVPECITGITYGLKWGITVSSPVWFAVLLAFLYLVEILRSALLRRIGHRIQARIPSHWYDQPTPDLPRLRRLLIATRVSAVSYISVPNDSNGVLSWKNELIHVYVIVLSFAYVFVMTKAAQIFDCRQLEYGGERGVPYMAAETSVRCYQGIWWVYFVFSLLAILSFGFGVLAFFGYVLLKGSQISKSPKLSARFRFLFVRFRDEKFYWELMVGGRKLAIALSLIMFGRFPMLIVLWSMLVIFISFILQTHHIPFRRRFHNVMEYVVLLSLQFLLFSGMLFFVDEFPQKWNKTALAWLCIVVVILSSVIILAIIVIDIISQYKQDKSRKKSSEEEEEEEEEEEGDDGDTNNNNNVDKYDLDQGDHPNTVPSDKHTNEDSVRHFSEDEEGNIEMETELEMETDKYDTGSESKNKGRIQSEEIQVDTFGENN